MLISDFFLGKKIHKYHKKPQVKMKQKKNKLHIFPSKYNF